jgi:hypothetical protein
MICICAQQFLVLLLFYSGFGHRICAHKAKRCLVMGTYLGTIIGGFDWNRQDDIGMKIS